MLAAGNKLNTELSPSPNLIFVGASFSILFPSQNFSLQICKRESFLAYQPVIPKPQTQQIAADNSRNKKNKPKIKFAPRVEFLITIYDINQQADALQNPCAWVMLQGFLNSEDLVWPISFRFPGLSQQICTEPKSLPQLLNLYSFRSLFSDQAGATSSYLSSLLSKHLPFAFGAQDSINLDVLAFTSYEFEKYWFAGFDIEPIERVEELKCDYGRLKTFHYASLFGRKMDTWVSTGAKNAFPIFHVDVCLEHKSLIFQPVFELPVALSDCERVFASLRNFHKASSVDLVLVLMDKNYLHEESVNHLKKSAAQNSIRCISLTHAHFTPVVRELLSLTE